jgi:hypothetical protein
MIPSTNSKLLVAEDWKKIYQSFKNSDFKSYDFETLRRTMISYLREKYPEDFNDYIESSEYIALIDLIAYLGQNLSFRVDLNARENFLETAQRRDSILRLAQLINYNPSRNVPGNGFLKLTAISTTDNVFDANGTNLSNTVIGWNDVSNLNWYQQFITILNSAMPTNITFGRPYNKDNIGGIPTEQYKFNSANTDVPVYAFSKTIGGITMPFEITSCEFTNKTYIYETPPKPGDQFSFIFQNDSKGSASANSGFFVHFRQGTLSVSGFSVANPVPNEIVGVNASDINDTDVWLWQLDSNGNYTNYWEKVDALAGNNVIYNSISNKVRDIYAISTRENDQIDLNFADGVFGNLPKGQFRLFYRQSNGLKYSIKPEQVNGVQTQVSYYNKSGQLHTLTLTFSLQYTVNNSEAAETNDTIKTKAPQSYYTQNRMITAEDYNIAPLTAGADIVKIKSVNRVSSGISKYYELTDVSGKYSSTNIFGSDGALYQEDKLLTFDFSFATKNEIYATIINQLTPIVESTSMRNFYYKNWSRPQLLDPQVAWSQVTKSTNQTTGYFKIKNQTPDRPLQTGDYSSNNLSYLKAGTLIKFIPPTGKYFLPNGKIASNHGTNTRNFKWVKVALVTGDGSYGGQGVLPDGTGPIILTQNVETDSIAKEIIPPFDTVISYALQTDMVNLCLSKRNFGLSFAENTRDWYIINDTDLDLTSEFSLVYQKDVTNANKDASWFVAFVWNGIGYEVRYRVTEYIFESEQETAFYFDGTSKNFDFVKNTLVKDQIVVLGINTDPIATSSLGMDYGWQIDSNVVESDGYIEPKKVKISFLDEYDDSQIENPDAFSEIVSPSSTSTYTSYKDKFVYFKKSFDGLTTDIISNPDILAYPVEETIPLEQLSEGQLFYLYANGVNVVKSYSTQTESVLFTLEPDYSAKIGRNQLKFHYKHNSGDDRRLDPSKTNLIDVYVLTRSYDTEYRNWLVGGAGKEPLPPTSSALEENYASVLEPIKAISDEIIYQPVKYKVLFGQQATKNLQAVFKAVRNTSRSTTENELKTKIISAIESFFALENWEFGQTFYFSELSTYVMNLLTPDITNFIIVPKADVSFGSLYEIACQNNEIFVNGATINDIEIIDAITANQIKTTSTIVNSTIGVY